MNHPLARPALRAFAALALSGLATAAAAHVTLQPSTAESGRSVRLVFGVTHGCDASPTRAVVVQVPAGLVGVKPMPKAGWTVTTQKAPLATPLQSHGRTVTESVSLVRWEAGPLASEHYDEFVLVGQVAAASRSTLPIAVTQLCEQGEIAWVDNASGRRPAPLLRVEPARGGGHH